MEELIVKERKFKEDIIGLINQSGLPALIIRPVISELLAQVQLLEQQQYQNAVMSMQNKEKEEEEVKQDE